MTIGKVWHIKYLIVNNVLQFGIYINMYYHSMRSHPAQFGETFDGPPTLERSGSEHRRAVTSFLLRRKAWLEVELPLERETEGFEKIPSLMGKSDANECNENSFSNCRVQLALSTKKDGMILEIFII